MKQPPPPYAPVDWETFLKVAVQVMPGRAIVTKPLPQAVPFQPENSDPTPGSAFSATRVPTANRAWHSVPHWMPGGDEVTDPMPPPSSAIVNGAEPPISVTAFAARSAT